MASLNINVRAREKKSGRKKMKYKKFDSNFFNVNLF